MKNLVPLKYNHVGGNNTKIIEIIKKCNGFVSRNAAVAVAVAVLDELRRDQAVLVAEMEKVNAAYAERTAKREVVEKKREAVEKKNREKFEEELQRVNADITAENAAYAAAMQSVNAAHTEHTVKMEKVEERERVRVAAVERELQQMRDKLEEVQAKINADERELAAMETVRVAAVERERVAAAERERVAAVERERVAAAERERVAAVERERVAAVKRQIKIQNNSDNLLKNSLQYLQEELPKPKILYISTHGRATGNIFMVPENVWIFFVTPNKEPAWGSPNSKFISGNPPFVQEILQEMHYGNYNDLIENDNFSEFRLYPPGGIIEDLNLNARLFYKKSGKWTFSGIMTGEHYLKEYTEEESKDMEKYKDFATLAINIQHNKMLRYNDTSDFNFEFDPQCNVGMTTTISNLLNKRKDKNNKIVLFISACRVISPWRHGAYSRCLEIDTHNNTFQIPIPIPKSSPKSSPQVNMRAQLLRNSSIGIGNTIINSNYFWLKDNKKEILNLLSHPHPLNKNKEIINNLIHNNTVLDIDTYCQIISEIIDYLKN